MRGYPSQVKGAGPPGVVGPHLRSELALGDKKKSCGVEPADGHVSLQGFESPSPHQLTMAIRAEHALILRRKDEF